MSTDAVSAHIQAAVQRICSHCAGDVIKLAAPLGLGKPNVLLNALYQRVRSDPQQPLQVFTALALARPRGSSELEQRFLRGFSDRHFGADYPDLQMLDDLRAGSLPAHVSISEFYLQSGAWLGVAQAQRHYTSLNYTHVARTLAHSGINVLTVLVAEQQGRYSLSCNPDLTLDLLDAIAAEGKPRPLVIGCVHPQLPFMPNDAEVPAGLFDLIVPAAAHAHRLFALPREAVSPSEHALGVLASALVRDGGSLQIGIGALADALVHGCLLRQREPAAYAGLLQRLAPTATELIREVGGTQPFRDGLYGASEMVMDGFMHLVDAGIVRRRVYDHLGVQQAINAGRIGHVLAEGAISAMRDGGFLPARLDEDAVAALCRFGVLPEGVRADGRELLLADGQLLANDLDLPVTRRALDLLVAGRALRGGQILAGAFFLGSTVLYQWLRELPAALREQINMTRVSAINQLYGEREALDAAQRHDARFFNTTMMVTLSGAAVSDGLENGQVVSGVGGQYNFVAMAHALRDGRSILLLRAVRHGSAGLVSNIVWNHGHCTIPRHLRDLVVTEYGIADLRGKNDEEVAMAMIEVADSRFQAQLVQTAIRAGKLRDDYQVPAHAARNFPQRLAESLRESGLGFATFPFGSDFDAQDLRLVGALKKLKASTSSWHGKLLTLVRAWLAGTPEPALQPLLARLQLDAPTSSRERLLARLVAQALR